MPSAVVVAAAAAASSQHERWLFPSLFPSLPPPPPPFRRPPFLVAVGTAGRAEAGGERVDAGEDVSGTGLCRRRRGSHCDERGRRRTGGSRVLRGGGRRGGAQEAVLLLLEPGRDRLLGGGEGAEQADAADGISDLRRPRLPPPLYPLLSPRRGRPGGGESG